MLPLAGEAGDDLGLLVCTPEFGLGHEAIGQSRVTQVNVDDQLAFVRDPRRQRDVMTAHLDLLVGNLEGFRLPDHSAERIDGDDMKIIAQGAHDAVGGDETEREKCALHGLTPEHANGRAELHDPVDDARGSLVSRNACALGKGLSPTCQTAPDMIRPSSRETSHSARSLDHVVAKVSALPRFSVSLIR